MNRHDYVILAALIPSWIYYLSIHPVSHDAKVWSILLYSPLTVVYGLTLAFMWATIYIYMRTYHNYYGLAVLIIASYWLIDLTVLRQIAGLMLVMLYAYMIKNKIRWDQRLIVFLACFTHIFSGLVAFIHGYYERKHEVYLILGLIPALFYLELFSWQKIEYVLRFKEFNPIDQYSISLRIILSMAVLAALIIGDRQKHQ